MKIKRVTSKKFKYIFFPNELEVYNVDPYKSVNIRNAFKDVDVKKWKRVKLVIGEDLRDLGYDNIPREKGYESSWYIANNSVPNDHVYEAVVGERA